jgi:GT2 family glycosyltransferase
MVLTDSLAIVIVNLNLKRDTAECIQSLLQAGARLASIIVVDNGSEDGSIEYLRAQFGEELPIIAAGQNRGYAYGLNLGIQNGLERGTRWFFLMNNDTIVDAKFFSELDAAVQQRSEYSIFGPLILYYSEPHRIWYLGDRIVPGTLITYNPFRGKSDQSELPPLESVDFVHGCGMLVESTVFSKIGLFDDWSLIYAEEVEFIWRARLAGFHCLGVTRAKMWHKISTYMSKQKPKTRFLRVRNQIRFYKHYSKGLGRVVMFLFTVLRTLRLLFTDIIQRQWELIRPLASGWVAGWFGPEKRDLEPLVGDQ